MRHALGLAAVLCLALATAVGGCGSGGGSSSTSTKSVSTTTTKSGGSSQGADAKPAGGGASDSSIERYGGAAAGSEKAAVIAAVHGFLTTMARQDYGGMCADLAAPNREQLESFGGGEGSTANACAAALKTLLNPAVATEARAAAAAPITAVRIKGDTAFALFRPKGGQASYLVVKREAGDSWKSISVTPGSPLEPSADR